MEDNTTYQSYPRVESRIYSSHSYPHQVQEPVYPALTTTTHQLVPTGGHQTIPPPQDAAYASFSSSLLMSPRASYGTNMYPSSGTTTRTVDHILDEAVDELFLSQPENEQIMDFVNAWDPTFYGGNDAALTNDTQLGNLLDKLLED